VLFIILGRLESDKVDDPIDTEFENLPLPITWSCVDGVVVPIPKLPL
jgi:hypothetical protein